MSDPKSTETCKSDTANVVLSEGTPVYVNDDLEKCREVAGEITAGHGKETTVHKDVTCDVDTDTDRSTETND